MPRLGEGMLSIWTGIPESDAADFHDWYDHEHVAERVAIPGFRWGRRYRTEGFPARPWLALYGTDDLGVFTSPAYVAALAAQTAWSNRMLAAMTGTERLVGTVRRVLGQGHGGRLMAAAASVTPAESDAWLARIEATVLAPSIAAGATTAWALESDPALSRPLVGTAPPPDLTGPRTWLVVVEGWRGLSAQPWVDAGLGVLSFDLMWALDRGETE